MELKFFQDRKEDLLKQEAAAQEQAIQEGNDLINLLDLGTSQLFALVQKYGDGDPVKMTRKLPEATDDPDLKLVAYFFGDIFPRIQHKLRIEWNPPKEIPFEQSSMRSRQILKDGEPCRPIQPAIWAKYKSPATRSDAEVLIRHMVVRPL